MKALKPRPFEPEVKELLAMCGETLDGDLLNATRRLREAAVEHDRADAAFCEAANDVMAILMEKLAG